MVRVVLPRKFLALPLLFTPCLRSGLMLSPEMLRGIAWWRSPPCTPRAWSGQADFAGQYVCGVDLFLPDGLRVHVFVHVDSPLVAVYEHVECNEQQFGLLFGEVFDGHLNLLLLTPQYRVIHCPRIGLRCQAFCFALRTGMHSGQFIQLCLVTP